MLQGSLDNFALDEVLGLLSSTAKTGRFTLVGDRGDGALELNDGQLVSARVSYTSNGTAPEDVVFELLRYAEGQFNFEVCEITASGETWKIDDVLGQAEERLADWRTIEAVVPSLDHMVFPVSSLPEDEVTINRAEWLTLRIIAAGCPVATVCDELGLGEVEGSRQIMGLADRDLVNVDGPESQGSVSAIGRRGVDSMTGYAADEAPTRRSTDYTDDADMAIEPDPLGSVFDGPIPEVLATTDAPPFPPPPAPAPPEVDPFLSDEIEPAPSTPPPPVASPSADDERPAREDSKPGGLLMRYLKSDD